MTTATCAQCGEAVTADELAHVRSDVDFVQHGARGHLVRLASYEKMTSAQRYELGRSDGYADGAHMAQWSPALVHDELAELRDRVRIARDGRASLAYFSAKRPERHEAARDFQAYTVGYARGFRESVADYERGRIARERFDQEERKL